MEHLECPVCLFLLCEPVTMSCGHSFCRRCIMGICAPSRCPVCSERLKPRDAKNRRNNVLLFCIIEKYCPEETRRRCEIQERLRARDFTEALRMVEDTIETGKGYCGTWQWVTDNTKPNPTTFSHNVKVRKRSVTAIKECGRVYNKGSSFCFSPHNLIRVMNIIWILFLCACARMPRCLEAAKSRVIRVKGKLRDF